MRVFSLLLLFLVSASYGVVTAQEASPGALDLAYPELVMTATDFAFEISGPVSAGPTLVTMVNDGAEPHHAQLMQLNDGMTFDDVGAALGGQDPNAIFGIGRFVGGPSAAGPGSQSQVILDLQPGVYVALCFIASPDGVPHLAKGMVQSFEVTASDAPAAAPEADATVVMLDFAFDMPDQVSAGPQIWEVVNEGPQPHEIGLLRLAPGVTPDQALGMFGGSPASPAAGHDEHGAASPEAAGDPPPFTAVGGMQGMATGLRGWVILNLEPGTYVAVCFIPDPATGQTHVALGMAAAFTVE